MRVDLPSSTLPTAVKRRRSFDAFRSRNSRMCWRFAGSVMSEVPLPLLLLHGSVGVVVDDPGAALGGAGDHHLLDDLLDARGIRANGPGARDTAEASESTEDLLDRLGRRRPVSLSPAEDVVENDDLSIAD